MRFGEPHPSPKRSSPTRLSTSGQTSYKGWLCRPRNVDSYSPVHTPQKSWTLITVAGRTSNLASIFFVSIKSKILEIQLQDNKCLQIREVVQQLDIDMYQRLLPQGEMAFKQTIPFYLLLKLRMFGVLPLLPHTLARCTTWFQEQSSFVTYLGSGVIIFPIGRIFTHSFLRPPYFLNL